MLKHVLQIVLALTLSFFLPIIASPGVRTGCLEYNRKPAVGAPLINALFKGMLVSARAQSLMHFDKYLPWDQHRFLDQNATVEDKELQYHHCEYCKNHSLSAK